MNKQEVSIMYMAELDSVEKKIRRLHTNKALSNKKIFLFGACENTRQIIRILRELGYEPQQIIDNDSNKQHSYCSRIKVLSVDEAIQRVDSDAIFLIYSSFWREMIYQLENKGYGPKQIYNLVGREKSVIECFFNCYRGKLVHKRLKRKYGDLPIFLCPYTGTGDIYLIGTFWKQYIEKHNIDDYIFLVISGACKKVASLFEIKNVELLRNQKESSYLISYYALCPEAIQLKLLNDGWAQLHTNPSEWFRGYKGLYFTELFRKFVFELPDTCEPEHPMVEDEEEEISKLFNQYGLVAGKTVVLSPYSNTLADLPDCFWVKIAKELQKRGYTVCTNSSGKTEPAIEGTEALFFPLNIARQFLDKAGWFIGVRSGFCDVISGSSAKKIILYDGGNRFYNCSAYEYFSLNGMGLCEDAVEVIYDNRDLEKSLETILENCKNGEY